MAEKISDNISEIAKAIKALKSDAAEASRATKSLNEDLKLDPTNVELEKYNVSLSWSIDFNTPQPIKQRRPQYVCTLSAITNSGGIIKDNVAMQTITYTTKDLPEAL